MLVTTLATGGCAARPAPARTERAAPASDASARTPSSVGVPPRSGAAALSVSTSARATPGREPDAETTRAKPDAAGGLLVVPLSPPGVRRRSGRPPSIAIQRATVGPAYSLELVRRVMRVHLADFRGCYARQLERAPDTAGELVVAFDIAGNGAAANARVALSTTHSAALDRCVVSVVAARSFPQPPGNATLIVRFPFVFATGR